MSETAEESPVRVGFFLIPDFPMLAFSAAIEALRVANWVSGRTLYRWTLFSEDGAPVSPSSGIAMTPHAAMTERRPLPHHAGLRRHRRQQVPQQAGLRLAAQAWPATGA